MKPSIQKKIKKLYPAIKKLAEKDKLCKHKIRIGDNLCTFGCANQIIHLFDYTGYGIIAGKEVRKYLLKNIKSNEDILRIEKIIIQSL